MTQDEIIAMAKVAGFDIGIWEKLDDQDTFFGYSIGGIHENLECFAKLIAAHEREACAKVCEEQYEYYGYDHIFAAKIRARGQQ